MNHAKIGNGSAAMIDAGLLSSLGTVTVHADYPCVQRDGSFVFFEQM